MATRRRNTNARNPSAISVWKAPPHWAAKRALGHRYVATTYKDQMGYWAVYDRLADKWVARRSIDMEGVRGLAEELNKIDVSRRGAAKMAGTIGREFNPISCIPSRWTPARVTRLKTGQIQIRIGGRR